MLSLHSLSEIKQRADRIQQQKDRTEREGIELTGDMAPMDDALSTLALLMKKTNTKTEVNTKYVEFKSNSIVQFSEFYTFLRRRVP